jgi:hypothetical protein
MKTGFYVFHPKRDSVVHADDCTGLVVLLDRVVDGGIKWQSYYEVFKEKPDL